MAKPEIYAYDDYRLFLKDSYQEKVTLMPKYSYRTFAKEAGFSNPGFLNDVIRGKRRLSEEALQKMIVGFDIKEREFFEVLVQYGQAKSEDDREKAYQQILFRRSRSSFTRINPSLIKYYQDYRYPLIRSAIEIKKFKGDYESLAHFLVPALPVLVVKKAVRDLHDWGLIKQGSDGHYSVTDKFVEPPSTLAQLVRQLNRTWILQGREAIGNFTPEERHISSILLGVSCKTKDKITQKIETFRQEIFELLHKDKDPEILMQLSMQYFPKSVEEKS